MELEFDKEIDAILRRARDAGAVEPASEHLDADVIAAFAEGAVPERSKPIYTQHLADCEQSRKLLASVIRMNAAEISAADESAPSAVSREGSSWFGNLFRTPNLAVAMGAIVLTFTGVLGYLVLRNQTAGDELMVSQTDTEMQKGGPSAGIELNQQIANSNKAANIAANAAASNAPVSSAAANVAVADGATNSLAARPAEDSPVIGRTAGNQNSPQGLLVTESKPSAAAPPPAPTTERVIEEGDRERLKSADKETKEDSVLLRGVRPETEDRRTSGNVPAAKKREIGPTPSGPMQSQPQINKQTYEMSVTRTAGGKKFTNRNGAWYDTAYRGEAMTNVRRGSEAYKNLDSGLRSIAETLGGTVIVVWKDRTYRIQ